MNPRVGQFFMTQRGQFRMAFDKWLCFFRRRQIQFQRFFCRVRLTILFEPARCIADANEG